MTARKTFTRSLSYGSALLLMVGALSFYPWGDANSTSVFAKQTGKACTQCHTDPKGGASLTPFGAAFKANGNKLPAATGDSQAPKTTP
ncbi:MAG: hypothetical protein ABJD53_15935 [Gammaproteobacteria bacterium]